MVALRAPIVIAFWCCSCGGGPAASTVTGTQTGGTTETNPSSSGPAATGSTGSGSTRDDSSDDTAQGGSSTSTGEMLDGWEWDLPPGFPEPYVPKDNPMTPEKVELGRHLFYDVRLSGNETQACSSCHRPELAFTDGRAVGLGSTGEAHTRGSMSLANVAYAASLTWANPLFEHLTEQAAVPLFGESPVELGATGMEDQILERLRSEPIYDDLFADAFGDDEDPYTLLRVRQAIASFQRTLISGLSPYDRYARLGEEDAISEAAKRGAVVFLSEQLDCHHCHDGYNLSNAVRDANDAFEMQLFANNGLYNIGGTGEYPPGGEGLWEFTLVAEDMGKFKPPTLRNIALTAPYMHDGSIETLAEVIDHYAAGGRNIVSGPHAGDGRLNPFKSSFVGGFSITDEDKADLLEFFDALTDDAFITNPRLRNPWKARQQQ